MKLPIKKKYFDQIKTGLKKFEVRDAHITFVCEETTEELRREIVGVELDHSNIWNQIYPDCITEDETVIKFYFGKKGDDKG